MHRWGSHSRPHVRAWAFPPRIAAELHVGEEHVWSFAGRWAGLPAVQLSGRPSIVRTAPQHSLTSAPVASEGRPNGAQAVAERYPERRPGRRLDSTGRRQRRASGTQAAPDWRPKRRAAPEATSGCAPLCRRRSAWKPSANMSREVSVCVPGGVRGHLYRSMHTHA